MSGPLTAPDGGPRCPPGLRWALIETKATGELTLCNPAGQRFTFGPFEAPHIAAALASHCSDDSERAFVASEWGPMDHEDQEGDDDA